MAGDDQVGIRPRIEIDGSSLPQELEALLEQVVVDDHLHLPDMFALRFRDAERQVVKQAHVEIGSKLRITVPGGGAGGPEVLIDGEVTALEAEYDGHGSRAVIRGYDGSHRLHRGRVTQTYQNVKDSDVARTVAQRAGLQPGSIDDSRTTHDHVSQLNCSDWDFLKARAAEIGFEVAVTAGKLHFRKPTPSAEAPAESDLQGATDALQLVFGKELLEFRPRLSSAEQVKEARVRGWDPKSKQPVVGSAPAGTQSARLPSSPGDLAAKFGGQTYLAVGPHAAQAEVDAAARAVAEQIGSAIAEAEGVARGNPRLKAGVAVSVGVVAAEFVGRYTLTHTRHVFDARGYRTQFEVSGRQDRSLLGLVSQPLGTAAGSAAGPPIQGVVVGLVTNNDDPEKQGRVKLKFPWLSDSYESDWARVAYVGAGPDSGVTFVPEVNDEVLVAFQFGHVGHPIVLGGLPNGKDRPRLGDGLIDNGRVTRRGIVSRRGHRFVLFDGDSSSGIALITSDGKIKVSLNETKGEIHLSCQGKIRVEAQGDLTLTSQQGVTIQAGTQLQLKGGAGAKLDGGPEVEVTGGMIKLN